MTSVILDAQSLASKWGFQDGDILDDILWDAGFEDDLSDDEHLSFFHEVLVEIVEKYLVPELGGVETWRIGTHHNPIRRRYDVPLPDIRFEVTKEMILRQAMIVKTMREERAKSGVNP